MARKSRYDIPKLILLRLDSDRFQLRSCFHGCASMLDAVGRGLPFLEGGA